MAKGGHHFHHWGLELPVEEGSQVELESLSLYSSFPGQQLIGPV